MICFPLDNTPYEAKDMGTYLATRTRGVFSSDGNLAVTPSESGLSVSVSPGLAWLKWSDYWGTAALQEQALTLDLDTADGALKRIDAIVCRLDKVNNRAEIVVKKGAPSSAPIVVPPVRDANYDELYIATVLIGAGVISISASAITDQRLNEEYCGLMRDGVTGIPTALLQEQVQQLIDHLREEINGVEQGCEVMLKTIYDPQGRNTDIFAAIPNPNLLDNSDFTNPVNQRGSTSYSGGGTYCIDRWDIASTATVAVVSDGIKITATTLSGIRQKIENITDGQLLVFQLCDNADTVYTQAFAASTTQAEYTTDFGKFRFVLNSGGVLTISILLNAGEKTFKWAKLEKGSVATPYVPKGYGAELAECQRYFKRVGNRGFRGWATNETNVVCCLTLATQMRVKPTITPVGTLTAYDEVSSVTVTMDSSTGSTVDTARITAHGTGLTAFRPYSLLGNVDISADL